MGFQVSPGVEVKEIDLTNVIPAVSTSIGGYSGYFTWGPVNEIGLVSSEKELAGKFGTPDAAHTQSFLTAASFLKYGNALKVVRAGDPGTMLNARAGDHEVPFGGIEAIAITNAPVGGEFTDVTGNELLSIMEDPVGTPAGSGSVIAPRFDIGASADSLVASLGYKVTLTDGTGLINTSGSVTLSTGEVVEYSAATAGTLVVTNGQDSGVPTDLYVQTNTGAGIYGDITVALTQASLITAPDGTAAAAGQLNATDPVTVYTTSNDTTSEPFTVAVGNAEGGFDTTTSVFNAADYTLGAGVADPTLFAAIGDKTGLVAYDASGAFIPGLFFTVKYDIVAIHIVSIGQDYGIANVAVGFQNVVNASVNGALTTGNDVATPLVIDGNSEGTITVGMVVTGTGIVGTVTVTQVTDQNNVVLSSAQTLADDAALKFTSVADDLNPGDFVFDEDERVFTEADYIPTTTAFEGMMPAGDPAAGVLPSKLFAKYPGDLGNSLAAYIIDAASWPNTPAAIQGEFDAAPVGTEVHVFIYDNFGEITGIAGSELEKFAFLDTEVGAKLANGSNNNYMDVVNSNSKWMYIAREVAGSATPFLFTLGADVATPGVANNADIMTGLEEFADPELVDVNLLFAQVDATDDPSMVIANKLMTIAATRKDAVAFVSPPIVESAGGTNPLEQVLGAHSALPRGIEGSYGVFDSTALYVYNKYADNYMFIPASGHMAGLCAKTDGIAEPWFSPAGLNRGSLLGVTKLAFNPKKAERDSLYKAGVNPIVSFPGQGIVLFGDKTAQSKPSAFDRINVRRLFIVLEKAIATAAKYQLFELNDEFTRAMFRNMTEPFLRDVKGRRGITDFLVVCDDTNNTGEVIDTNRFVADIYIKPARSINFITLNFIATRTGVDFSEIVGK